MLRERGKSDEAERLRCESLPPLLAAVRSPAESDAVIDGRLAAIFAVETERVANAAVLADLLLPMISEQFQTPGDVAALVSRPAPIAPLAPSLGKAPAARPGPASIADFIDEMIALESEPDRPGNAPHRHAS